MSRERFNNRHSVQRKVLARVADAACVARRVHSIAQVRTLLRWHRASPKGHARVEAQFLGERDTAIERGPPFHSTLPPAHVQRDPLSRCSALRLGLATTSTQLCCVVRLATKDVNEEAFICFTVDGRSYTRTHAGTSIPVRLCDRPLNGTCRFATRERPVVCEDVQRRKLGRAHCFVDPGRWRWNACASARTCRSGSAGTYVTSNCDGRSSGPSASQLTQHLHTGLFASTLHVAQPWRLLMPSL